jgi:hypothetical protein
VFGPSHIVAIDLADARLEAAKRFGADVTVNNAGQDPQEVVQLLTNGLGADVAIEAVGMPATFELAARLARPGGRIANIGVHGEPVTLHLEELWIKNVTITTGLVDAYSTATLLRLVTSHQIDAAVHHPPLRAGRLDQAYDVFSRAADTSALSISPGRRIPLITDCVAAATPIGYHARGRRQSRVKVIRSTSRKRMTVHPDIRRTWPAATSSWIVTTAGRSSRVGPLTRSLTR